MNKPQEVERLTKVYSFYHSDTDTQSRWDIDNPGNRHAWDERRERTVKVLTENQLMPLTNKRILEIGCGNGNVLADFLRWGADPSHVYGIDLMPNRIEQARQLNPGVNFACGNAQSLDFADNEFDLVLLVIVLSSILDDSMSRDIVAEVTRVLKPGGSVLLYDFRYNNRHNPNTKAITKYDLRRLFPSYNLDVRPITLLPPLSRRLGKLTPWLYPTFNSLPLLRSHYLALLTKTTD